MEKQRPTYPQTNLMSISFDNVTELKEWANGEFGTDYIISITYLANIDRWILFYIKDLTL